MFVKGGLSLKVTRKKNKKYIKVTRVSVFLKSAPNSSKQFHSNKLEQLS